MKQDKDTIRSYFETGDKPTQEHYYDTWDSFWHKDELLGTIPNAVFIDAVNGNDSTGTFKAEAEPFKTFSSAMAALPVDDGTPMFVFIKNGLVIDGVIPNRNLYIISLNGGHLDFNYSGNIYDNTGGVYNELFIKMRISRN